MEELLELKVRSLVFDLVDLVVPKTDIKKLIAEICGSATRALIPDVP